MTSLPDPQCDYFPERFSWREARLWSVAGIVVLCAYGGAALAIMRAPSAPVQQPNSAPAAIMIDLAPEAVAPTAPRQSIATAEKDAPQVDAKPLPQPENSPEEPVPEETEPELPPPPEKTETAKPAPAKEPPPDTVEKAEVPPLTNVEVPVPTPRPPAPRREAKPKRQEHHREATRQAPSQASQRAALAGKKAPVAAARQSSRGAAPSLSPAEWQARLLARLESNKRYPSSARARSEEGTADVRFRIDADGHVLSVAITRSSGFPDLDAEVIAMVRRSSPVPPPPPGINRTIVVPVQFNLR